LSSEPEKGAVIHAFPSREVQEPPVRLEPEHYRNHCHHLSITLQEHERQVVCSECGAVLDPFDYLRGQVIAIRRGWGRYQEAQTRESKLRESIVQLEREQKRLKAQNQRLRDKAAASPFALDMHKTL